MGPDEIAHIADFFGVDQSKLRNRWEGPSDLRSALDCATSLLHWSGKEDLLTGKRMLYQHILRSTDLNKKFDKGAYLEKDEYNTDCSFSHTNGGRIDYIYQPCLLHHVKHLLLERYIGNDCGSPANVLDVAHAFMVFGQKVREIKLFPASSTMYRIKDEQIAEKSKRRSWSISGKTYLR